MTEVVYMGLAEPDGNGSGNCIEVVSSMPSVSVGKFVLYNGTTTSSYTNGYIYKGVNVVQTPYSPESLTVTQTDGITIGDITTDLAVFKSAMNPDRTFTFTFSCVGRPLQISLNKFENGFKFLTLTRDTVFDNTRLHIYSWVDGSNNYYFTTTEVPTSDTIFYVGSTDDVSQPTNVNSGWEYLATNTRRTNDPFGMWRIGSSDEEISLSDYGIYSSSRGVTGDVLSVAYSKEVLQVANDQWVRVDVQPLDLSQVSGYDATKNQTLTHDNTGAIAWTDTII